MGRGRFGHVVAVLIVFGLYSTRGLDVSTPVGTFSGRTVPVVKPDEETRNASLFFGIPFAKPPLGDRRFKRPEPADALSSVHDASYHRPLCMQKINAFFHYIALFNMSEDCLYLNIYAPGSEIPTNKVPVMIWIHGGAFLNGGANIYDARAISAYNDVIVVTVNYRLNVFGFLSSGENGSGNYGLWDQSLAINWVHENIAAFGGNPEQMTLFGESAGAASVLYQAVYPGNNGLFKRVIAESGSIMSSWALQANPKSSFDTFSSSVGCHGNNVAKVIDCLRMKTSEQLLQGDLSVLSAPNVDGEFVTTNFLNANEIDRLKGMTPLKDIELLSGVNSKDGGSSVNFLLTLFKQYGDNIDIGISRSTFEKGFIPMVLRQLQLGTEEMIKAAIFAYTDWSDPDNKIKIRGSIVDFLSDVQFFVPAINVAILHNSISNNSGYFYEFDHIQAGQTPTWLQGANHAMEIGYVFGFPAAMLVTVGLDPSMSIPYPAADRFLSNEMMKMWTNFAKTGDPNRPVSLATGVVWPKFDPSSTSYLHITSNLNANSSKVGFAAKRLAFWNQLVPTISQCRKQNQNKGNRTNAAVNHLGNLISEAIFAMLIILYICI